MRPLPSLLLLGVVAALAAVAWTGASPPVAAGKAGAEGAVQQAAAATLAQPRFLPNRGQWAPEVAFAVLGAEAAWVHDDGFTVRLERIAARTRREAAPLESSGCVVRTRFLGAGVPQWEASGPLPGSWHFLAGTGTPAVEVPASASVCGRGVLPGIDVCYRPVPGGGGPLEYDLLLAPGADLGAVVAECDGASALRVDAAGQLCITVVTPDGPMELRQQAPVAWQETGHGRRPLAVSFRLLGDRRYGFVAPDLDPAWPATVDPGVVWSTYLGGGASDSINDLVWRPGVGLWVAGWAGSSDFPTTTGAYRTTGQQDGFLARLDPSGSSIVYATYLGGSLGDEVRGLALGPNLEPTVTGFTRSPDFPVTAGAYQATYGGGSLVIDVGDAFVTHLSANGSTLLGSTYLGGLFDDVGEAVAVDAAGNAVVAGWTSSGNLPTTGGAWRPALGGPLTLQTDGFVAKLPPNGGAALYCTYAGGQLPDQLLDVVLDPATGEAIAAGWTVSADFPTSALAYRTSNAGAMDMVLLRLNAAGSAAVFSTYLGGADNDLANAVVLAADGTIWCGGTTVSTNFPTSPGAPQRTHGGLEDGFVAKFAANGSALPYSTLFGGAGADQVRGLAVDGVDVLAVGETTGSLPVTGNAFQPLFGGGTLDGFVLHLGSAGASIDLASYVGGSGDDVLDSVALGGSGLGVLGGWSFAADFPITPGALQTTLRGVEDGVLVGIDLATDLGDSLRITSGGDEATRVVQAGEHEVLVARLENLTDRDLQITAVRLLVAGQGDAVVVVRRLQIALEVPEQVGVTSRVVAGPMTVNLDDGEIDVPLNDLWLPGSGSATLRVRAELAAPGSGMAAELAMAVVDAVAWSVRAAGAGAGPLVRVDGTGRVQGPVLVLGALPTDADGDGTATIFDLRRMCVRLGQAEPAIDVDGDGVVTSHDLEVGRGLVLGRATVLAAPTVVTRGGWFTVRGAFPAGSTVEASLGGLVPVPGRQTPREVTFRVDPTQPPGTQELRLSAGGRLILSRTVTVQ